jgi:hypothetical protein
VTADELAQALRAAVRAQGFEQTADPLQGGEPLGTHPSLDLAVVAFPEGQAPVAANVLFSREHPEGLTAQFDGPSGECGAVSNIRFDSDVRAADGHSPAWQPGADWAALHFPPWFGAGPERFVSPYPASLVKLMVLVGVARLVDQGRSAWGETLVFAGRQRPVQDWAMDMTAISCNEATEALVAHLHERGAIERRPTVNGGVEVRNELHDAFDAYGLPGLRLANTQPDGGWRNFNGAGVGQLQMTAWDTARLLWLIEAGAPPAPWLPAGMPRLLRGSAAVVRECLAEQALHEIASSGILVGLSGWVAGIPARLPLRWLDRLGELRVGELHWPGPLQAQAGSGEVVFANKTGTTENYASVAGSVRGIAPHRRHYLLALTSNLGSRYRPHPAAATTWRLPALGAAIDGLLKPWLEAAPPPGG